MASLATFHHGFFPLLHHLPGTLCLYTVAVSTNYQPLNINENPTYCSLLLPSIHPVVAPQIRLMISGALCVCVCVCMINSEMYDSNTNHYGIHNVVLVVL